MARFKKVVWENPKADRHMGTHEVKWVKKTDGNILLQNRVGQEIEIPRELRAEFINFLTPPEPLDL